MPQAETPESWNADIRRLGGGFSQSWEWGTFQEKAHGRIARLRDASGAPALWVRHALPFGRSYWYCPRGPIIAFAPDDEAFRGATFLRIEPSLKAFASAKKDGWQEAAARSPEDTVILDLSKDEGVLLAGMHQKTRYNINLAEKKGVCVYHASSTDPADFEVFWSLVEETTKRGGFSAHDKAYYRLMLETLAGDPATDGKTRPVARLVFAEHDGRVLAANVMIWFGDTCTYLHGASGAVRREVMAPHALHWSLIKEAKAWGYVHYDFWGVAPLDAPESHPWAGISRFKRGFGGAEVSYPGTFDVPLDKLAYFAYSLVRRLRR